LNIGDHLIEALLGGQGYCNVLMLSARRDAGRVMSCHPQWDMSRDLATTVVVG